MRSLLSFLYRKFISEGKTVYFVPFKGMEEEEVFFAPGSHFSLLRKHLEKLGYKVKITNFSRVPIEADYVFFNNLQSSSKILRNIKRFPKEKLSLVLWEPRVLIPHMYEERCLQHFSQVLTWDCDLIDGKRFFPFHFPHDLKKINPQVSFAEKKLCTLMNANKTSSEVDELYSERRRAIEYFDKYHPEDFEFYGWGWENEHFKTYKGTVSSKLECIKN
jgi:hypothetical protein